MKSDTFCPVGQLESWDVISVVTPESFRVSELAHFRAGMEVEKEMELSWDCGVFSLTLWKMRSAQ